MACSSTQHRNFCSKDKFNLKFVLVSQNVLEILVNILRRSVFGHAFRTQGYIQAIFETGSMFKDNGLFTIFEVKLILRCLKSLEI